MRMWTQSGAHAQQLPSLISSAFDRLDAGLQTPRVPEAASRNGAEPTGLALTGVGTEQVVPADDQLTSR
jgi:hypothetical protein